MKKTNFKRIILTALAIILALSMCFAVVGCSDGDGEDKGTNKGTNNENGISAKEALEGYCKASIVDYDVDATMAYFHEDVLAVFCEEQGMTIEEYEETLNQGFDLLKAVGEQGAVVDYEITDNDDFDSSVIIDKYAEYGIEFDEVASFIVTTHIEFDGQAQDQEEATYLVKIDGDWYICFA